jgi:hypothetical protein
VELSRVLNSLPIHTVRPDLERFRNPNGVALKLANFAALDPAYPGRGIMPDPVPGLPRMKMCSRPSRALTAFTASPAPEGGPSPEPVRPDTVSTCATDMKILSLSRGKVPLAIFSRNVFLPDGGGQEPARITARSIAAKIPRALDRPLLSQRSYRDVAAGRLRPGPKRQRFADI